MAGCAHASYPGLDHDLSTAYLEAVRLRAWGDRPTLPGDRGRPLNEHVLVVDDDPEIRDSLRRGLSVEGYAVSLAEDGAEALSVARDRAPDLVVLGVMLPEQIGRASCRERV